MTKQLYFPDTAMLITRFMTPNGVGEVLDFMPVIEGKPTDRHRLVRHLRVARGTMQFVLEIQPRFNYGRSDHSVEVSEERCRSSAAEDGMHLTLHTAGRVDPAKGGAMAERAGDGLRATFTMREGESGKGVVLESMGDQPRAIATGELDKIWPKHGGVLEADGWAARATPDGGARRSAARR